jgi:hypothetical protein
VSALPQTSEPPPPAAPGRNCPLSYRYGASSLRRSPELAADTLYAAGGLYGNLQALQRIEQLLAQERMPAQLVFNGDFHWFDTEPGWFAQVHAAVLRHPALRGNVETEIAADDNGTAGCGCAYPAEVDEAVVQRSNRIMRALREAARCLPDAQRMLAGLAQLPMNLRVQVGAHRVAVVHGDADALAGWQFDASRLHAPGSGAALLAQFEQADVDVFASTHTCLPALRCVGSRGVVVNNGAAGMPNFAGSQGGVVTRISVHAPGAELPVLYGGCFDLDQGPLHVHALHVAFDAAAWEQRFLGRWPPGSDAHASYWQRIRQGPAFTVAQALGQADPAGAFRPSTCTSEAA